MHPIPQFGVTDSLFVKVQSSFVLRSMIVWHYELPWDRRLNWCHTIMWQVENIFSFILNQRLVLNNWLKLFLTVYLYQSLKS